MWIKVTYGQILPPEYSPSTTKMSEPISCNFTRCAIYNFTTKHQNKMHRLPKGSYAKIPQDYHQLFGDIPILKATYNVASKKFNAITKSFGCKWHPNDAKQSFLFTFSLNEWQTLASEEKSKHTLKGCEKCIPFIVSQRRVAKLPQICFNTSDLSTLKQFGSKLLQEANELSEAHFQKPIQQVLEQTPESKLLPKPSTTERLYQKRQILSEIKNEIEDDMNSQGDIWCSRTKLVGTNLMTRGKLRAWMECSERELA